LDWFIFFATPFEVVPGFDRKLLVVIIIWFCESVIIWIISISIDLFGRHLLVSFSEGQRIPCLAKSSSAEERDNESTSHDVAILSK
jgi:hypothetical protein